jgi:hypothetical protein
MQSNDRPEIGFGSGGPLPLLGATVVEIPA